jgi:hypothetical protein
MDYTTRLMDPRSRSSTPDSSDFWPIVCRCTFLDFNYDPSHNQLVNGTPLAWTGVLLSPRTLDETGQVYGALKVIEYAGNDGHALWAMRVRVRAGEVQGQRKRAARLACSLLRPAAPESAHTQRSRLKVPKRRRRAIARKGGKTGARDVGKVN